VLETEAAGLADPDEVWRRPEWYRALTLEERCLGLNAQGGRVPRTSRAREDSASERVRAWKTQRPFVQESLFATRLALDGITEDDLLALLAESPESLAARAPGIPVWLIALQEAFTQGDGDPDLQLLLDQTPVDHPLAQCLPALAPLLGQYLRRLSELAVSMSAGGAPGLVEPDVLASAWLANIAYTILYQISKPVVLELHLARREGRLRGASPEARFKDFVRQLMDERLIVPLLATYPVLARQLVLTLEQWTDFLGEFLRNLQADWPELLALFSPGAVPGPLVGIEAGKGDRHRRGRSVLALRFASGLELLYKPKPLAADVHFQELLCWLNDRGADPPLRPVTLLDRGDYGWSEFVHASPCGSREEIVRFYQRQGGYLALLYALDATDLHNENLIAAGEHPVLVDLESLFHPRVHGGDPLLANLAAGTLEQSVWQVGLLPHRIWSAEESVGVDMSGLGGAPGQMNPHRLIAWEKPGTDEMRLVRRRVELPTSENQPRLPDQDIDVADYQGDIVEGFTRMYRLLCEHRAALVAERLTRFAHDEIRAFARPTNVYGLLWYESFHPDLLRDALDRDRFFDRLWVDTAQRPYLVPLTTAERRDLWRGDIPLFTTFPDSRAIFSSEGERLDAFFDRPSVELVRHRVERLGEADLAKQRWIVEASLATLRMGREDAVGRPVTVPEQARPAGPGDPLALARSLGRRLDELALQDDAGAAWLGVGPVDESTWSLYPSGIDLYDGGSGIALFLAYLGAITNDPAPTALARKALTLQRTDIRSWLDATGHQAQVESHPVVGAFVGLPSVIYLLTNLGVLWGEPELLDEAEALTERLPPLIEREGSFDVIHGSAGCILVLLALHSVRPSQDVLDVAVQCGHRLLATSQPMAQGIAWPTLKGEPPLGGFSHGTAGIAFSLLQLAGRSGDQMFRAPALRALEFDRSLFVPELSNWADLRTFASGPVRRADRDAEAASSRKGMVAWCHGAPGIGLARLAALEHLDDDTVRHEIDVALVTTTRFGFVMNHSLCHGALGNAELLLTAAQVLGRPRDHQALARATAEITADLEAHGPVTGVPLGIETPGLMTGLAGMGYELLRLAEPAKLPAALVLAPPRWQA
jgi:type 2 lantibiotic biosynthesis protein LanM